MGQPVIVGSMSDYAVAFGPVMARKYDMGTQIATAVQQGAQNFRCVRVTDGTDSAASLALPAIGVHLHRAYTGTLGNQISVALASGSKANTWRLTVALPGLRAGGVRQHRRHRRGVLAGAGECGERGAGAAARAERAGDGECRRAPTRRRRRSAIRSAAARRAMTAPRA